MNNIIIQTLKRIPDIILCQRYQIPEEPTIGLAHTVIGSRGYYGNHTRLNAEHTNNSCLENLSFRGANRSLLW